MKADENLFRFVLLEPYTSYTMGPSFGCGVAALSLGLISLYIKGAVLFIKKRDGEGVIVSLEKDDPSVKVAQVGRV